LAQHCGFISCSWRSRSIARTVIGSNTHELGVHINQKQFHNKKKDAGWVFM
jgi:hypothetical protein